MEQRAEMILKALYKQWADQHGQQIIQINIEKNNERANNITQHVDLAG